MLRFLAQRRGSLFSLIIAAVLALAPAIAEARMGGGGSFGSRGSRTWSAPPSTRTAPGTASPFERSDTARPSYGTNQPGFNSPAYGGSSFGRGLLGGLAGGLLGAGLFGLLTGNGFFGGMGGFMSFIGFLLQIALIVFLARMAFAWWQRRNAPAGAGPQGSTFSFTGGAPFGGRAGGAGFGAGPMGAGAAQQPRTTPLKIAGNDFNAFERLLGAAQGAYSHEDLGALRGMATPEMVRQFEDELEANRRKGVVNRVSEVKLLQGDLSEAWSEGRDDYATVAMRFALNDVLEDISTGKPAPGSQGRTEATELWTFRRPAGAGPDAWKLSAIQQAA